MMAKTALKARPTSNSGYFGRMSRNRKSNPFTTIAGEIKRVVGFPAHPSYDWLDVVAELELNAFGDATHPANAAKLTPDQWGHLTALLNAPSMSE